MEITKAYLDAAVSGYLQIIAQLSSKVADLSGQLADKEDKIQHMGRHISELESKLKANATQQ